MPPPVANLFLLRGMLKFAKLRSGCRYYLYQFAEKCHGKVREEVRDDGISYIDRSPHLSFQLLFEEKCQAEDFESEVARIPGNYRKRKLSESSEVAPAVEVELHPIQRIVSNVQVVRVFESNYQKLAELTDGSPEFDVFSHSLTSVVDINEETKLRMVERENSFTLFRQKPERCHLISQSKYKDDSKNPNNIVFMSRNLHQQFDAIDSAEGIPMFYLLYIGHHSTPFQGLANNRPCQVYETTVNVVFKDEEAMSVLSFSFITHTVISNTTIQLVLYFPSPEEFKTFSDLRAEESEAKWRSYDGSL